MWETTTMPPSSTGATSGWANSFRSSSQKARGRGSCSNTPAACSTGCARWASTTSSSISRKSPAIPTYRSCVEWLGAPWGHAVAPSTPVQDFRLHVRAWQHHFAAIFGIEALQRVRGFSPSEMALPNHPDVCYEFVKTLRECGYRWVLVQEHTVERVEDGGPVTRPHIPHRLVARNSRGQGSEHHRHHQDPRAATPSSSPRCSPTTRPADCRARI